MEASEAFSKPKQEVKSEEGVKVEGVDYEEAMAVLDKTEIHGTPFQGKSLTTDIIREEGLTPFFKLSLKESGVTCLFSNLYEGRGGRPAVVAYVKTNGSYNARTFYLSNSQGVWRYLPRYRKGENGQITWFDKGYNEISITLPMIFQGVLADMQSRRPLQQIAKPDLVFAGTARDLSENVVDTYRLEVGALSQTLSGDFYGDVEPKPESLKLSPEQSPDFSKVLASWSTQSSLYGGIEVEAFKSKDGKLTYMFCRDKLGRVWIGGIENDSPIRSVGLRDKWISGGHLTTPAFEYGSMVGKWEYANSDLESGPYVDMFKNYLSRAPIIQEYIQSRTKRVNSPKSVDKERDQGVESAWTLEALEELPLKEIQFILHPFIEEGVSAFLEIDENGTSKKSPKGPAGLSVEGAQKLLINKAKKFLELVRILADLPEGILVGKNAVVSVEELIRSLWSVASGRQDAELLTNVAGVRDKYLQISKGAKRIVVDNGPEEEMAFFA